MKKTNTIILVIILVASSYILGLNQGSRSAKGKRVSKAHWLADAQVGNHKLKLETETKKERTFGKIRQFFEGVASISVSSYELGKSLIDK